MFNAHVFQEFPSAIIVTPDAVKSLDRLAIHFNIESHAAIGIVWALHMENVNPQLANNDVQLANGGCFISILPYKLAVVDAILPPTLDRKYIICSESESDRVLMDIEDFINHSGNQIMRLP